MMDSVHFSMFGFSIPSHTPTATFPWQHATEETSKKREGHTTNEWEKLSMAAFHPWFSQHQVEWAQLPKSSTRNWPQWSQQNTTNATATHSTGSAVDSAFHYSAPPLCAYVGLAPQLTAPPTHNYMKQPSIAPSATAEWAPDSDRKKNKLYNHHSLFFLL